jgi:L-threonylcarbamoyladenylate synthase
MLAARGLARGGVVAFPTETVYGLGASIRHPEAVAKIFEIKGRPLTVHVRDAQAIETWTRDAPPWVGALVEELWPGPLTLVLPRQAEVPDVVTGGGATVGLRAPDHPLALALFDALAELEGGPAGVAAPSANRFGQTPPTTAGEVQEGLGAGIDFIVDGGRCALGIESTVLDASGESPRILRPGAISASRIERICGRAVLEPSRSEDTAQMRGEDLPVSGSTRVYPFSAKDRDALRPGPDSAVIARADPRPGVGAAVRWVRLPRDDAGFAREFYPTLRELEREGRSPIYVELAAGDGELAAAINARIARRSAPE